MQIDFRSYTTLLRTLAARTFVAVFALLVGSSCGDNQTGPEQPTPVSLQISVETSPPIDAGSVDVASVEVRLTRSGGGVVLDTVVTLNAGQNPLSSQVFGADNTTASMAESEASSPAASYVTVIIEMVEEVETYGMNVTLFDDSGQAIFESQSTNVVVRKNGDNSIPPQNVSYVGPGTSAASVEVVAPGPVLFFGNTMTMEARALNADGEVIPNVPFVWSSPDGAMVTVDDLTGQVAAGSVAGEAQIVATVHSSTKSGAATVTVRKRPASILVVSGADQTAPIGTTLPDVVRVRVVDGDGQGIDGVPVHFTDNNGGQFDQETVATDPTGHAEVSWTLGQVGGSQVAVVTIPDVPEVEGRVGATSYGEAAAIEVTGGNGQTGTVGRTLADPLVIRVTDDGGNPVVGQAVDFVVVSGGGTVVANATETDETGAVSAIWTLGTSTAEEQVVEVQMDQSGAAAIMEVVRSLVDPILFTATAMHDQPTGLSFTTQPVNTVAGAGFGVAVTEVDQYGNPATSASSIPVTLAIAAGSGAGGANLSGTNPVSTTSGVATFDGMSIDVAGQGYLLEATAGGLATATSASFDVEMGTVVTVEVTPAVATASSLGEIVSFTAVARNGSGIEVPGVTFTWSENSSGTVATIDQNGQATTVSNGTTQISATASGVSGDADLTVNQEMASIELSPAAATLTAIGATQQFTAQALDANGFPLPTQPTFTWGGGGTVASVSPTGLATALTQGTTQVTASSGVTTGSADLTVTQDINSVVVTPASVTLDAIGATQQFAAEAQDINGNPLPIQPTFTWSSSDEAVATVGITSGLATTTGNGNAVITASAAGVEGSADLTVTQEIGSIVVTPASATMDAVGDTQQYTAEARDLSGVPLATQPAFAWSSSNDAVATVNETTGLATAVANGSVNINASAAGVTGSANLTVAQVTSSIVVTPAAATIEAIDAAVQLTAQALDANGNPIVPQPAFTWESNNHPVATVGVTNGLTTGHAEGAAQISASANGAIGVADVTVAQTVASIVVTPPAVTLNAFGASQQYSAEAHDANGYVLATQPTFTWAESSSGAVATIDPTGLATAAGNGTTQISASVSGVTGSVGLTVTQTISAIVVDPPTATLTSVGATQQFAAEARDANDYPLATQPAFTWGGGGSVATVDGSGMATAQAQGTTDVTATAGGVTGSAALTVTQDISSIVVTPSGVTLTAFGQTQQYSAQALDAGSNPLEIQPTFAWTSSDEGVATVGGVDGLAQAVGNGTTQILASAGGVTGGIDLTVAQVATSVVVSPAAVTLDAIGGAQPYTAEARDANDNPLTTQPTFAWTESSAGAVATIDPATGLATATGNGTSVITATGGGVSGNANLTVTQAAASIVVTPNPVTLNSIGVTQQFVAQALDANSNPLVTQPAFVWSETSSGAVATVDASGLATTSGNGSTQITATGGGVSGFTDLTVTQVATSIVVTPNPVTLNSIGVTQQFAAQALDANSTALVTQPTFVWTETSSGTVATVDASGMATTTGNGATQVTATAGAVSGFADLTVAQTTAAIVVTFNPDTTLDAVGATTTASAEARDANGTTLVTQPASFTWQSLSQAVATVNPASGLTTTVTAVTNGTADIQAGADGVTGSATVTVAQVADSIAVTFGQDTLPAIGATTSVNAEAFDANGNSLAPQPTSFNWSSLDESVATVSPAAGSNTTAEAVADGAADIQAEVGGVTGSATLTVKQAIDSIAVTLGQDTLQAVGATTSVSAQAFDVNGNLLATQPTSFNWSSLNMAVATVSPAAGLNTTAEAVANGTADIQAEVDGVIGSATLTVKQVATQIQVTLNAATLNALGDTTTASAEAQDANGNPLNPQPASFTWSSLNTAVAMVSPATGLTTRATADSNGTADIQAEVDGVAGSATLTVSQVATSFAVTPAAASMVVGGDSTLLTAKARDANDSALVPQPSISWISTAPTVVDITQSSGDTTRAWAVANGTAQLIATSGTFADTATITVGAYVWTGAGTDDNWSTAENWSPAGPPTSSSDVVINQDGVRVEYDLPTGTTAANNITIDGTATLAVDSVDFLIGGKLTVEQSATFEIDFATITAEIDNKGTWNVFHNASTLLNPSAGSAHTNSGTILMHVPLYIMLEDATFTNTGTMTINDMIAIDMADTPETGTPSFTNSGAGELDVCLGVEVGGGTFNFAGGSIHSNANVWCPPITTLTFYGSTVNLTADYSTGTAQFDLRESSSVTGTNTLTNNTVSQALVLNGSDIVAPLVNDQVLEVLGSSAFTGTAVNNGTVSGTGTLDIGTAFTNPGDLSPAGTSIGQLGIVGNLTQAATSEIDLQLGGSTGAPSFDVLAISGSGDFTGTTLNGLQSGGYTPATNAVLQVITCGGGCSGTFDNTSVNVGGVNLDIVVNANNVELRGPAVVVSDTTVTVTPVSATITTIGGTQQYTAVADTSGVQLVPQPTFDWTESSSGAVATIDGTGLATAVANGGPITITATIQGTSVSGTASLTVQEGADYLWTGAGIDDNWSTAANWSPAGPPASGANVFINNQDRVIYDLPTGTVAANDLTIGGTATLAVPSIDFVIGGTLTIQSTGVFETDGTVVIAELNNQGTWNVFHNSALLMANNPGSTAHTNSGTIQMNVPLWIDMAGATYTNTGLMNVNDILTVDFTGGGSPVFTNSGSGQILIGYELDVLGAGTFNYESGTLAPQGTPFLFALSEATANFTPSVSTIGMVMDVMDGATLNGPGTLTHNSSDTFVLNSSTIGAPLINNADMEVQGISAFTGTSAANNGMLFGTATLDVSGTTFTNPGTLSPGGSAIGQLSLVGNLTQAGTSEIDIDLGGTTAVPSFDVLAISGTGNFTGTTLNATQLNGYVPAADAVLEIMTCGTGCSGAFDNTTVSIGGVNLTITVNANNVELKGPSAP
jgi:uncharacterized protein YjdB